MNQVDVERIAEKLIQSSFNKEKIQNVLVLYTTSGRFIPNQEVLGQLIDALKTKGKLKKLFQVDLDRKSISRGEDDWTLIGEATERDDTSYTFVIKLKKGKPQIVELEEMEEGLESEAQEFVDWVGDRKKADEIVEEMGFDLSDISEFMSSGNEVNLGIGSEDWLGFADYDEAEQYATDSVRQDLEDNPEYFNQDWLFGNVDQDKAENFFRQMYQEMDDSYAYDIQSESSSEGYANRLVDELVQWGIVSDDEASKEDFDGSDNIDEFVEQTIDSKIKEGNGGYDHYAFNFGDSEARDLLIKHNLIDIDGAAEDAVHVDGVGHFLAHYDGNELEVVDTYWYRQN